MSFATVLCHPPLRADWQTWNHREIAPNEITLFRMPVADGTPLPTWWLTLLSEGEAQRCARFRQPADRQRYLLGRGLLRLVAGLVTGQPPRQLLIDTAENGKPEVQSAAGWHFNGSHSGEWVLLAVGQTPLGVDVEYLHPSAPLSELVPATLHPEERNMMTKATNERLLFYELWARKEALVKATGIGLTDDFTALQMLEGKHTVGSRVIGATGSWQVISFGVADAYPAALAQPGLTRSAGYRFYTVEPGSFTEIDRDE